MNNLLFLTKKKALKEFPRGWRDRFTGAPQRSFQEGKDTSGRAGLGLLPRDSGDQGCAPWVRGQDSAPAGSHSALLRGSVFRAPGPRTRPGAGRPPEVRAAAAGPRTWARTETHLVPPAALARLHRRPEDPQPPRSSRGRRRSPRRL